MIGSKKVSVNLGKTKRYAQTPRAYMWVDTIDAINYGYYVKTYVSWKNPSTNALVAARSFARNESSDYRCVDINNNGGSCDKSTFTNGDFCEDLGS